ncbi:MAG: hydroxyacid dehydrogenase [Candidatus Acidiferrales bacterium]
MSQGRIIATARVLPVAHEILSRYARIEIASATDENSLVSMMDGAIGLIVRGVTPITRRVIEAGTNLRVIGRTGVGFDNVDINAATECGIPVVFAPGAGSKAVAEGALSMLLALAKRLPQLDQKTRAGQWQVRDEISMGDLYGATLGLVGLGRIGSEVARLAKAFGMNIIGYDPAVSEGKAKSIGVKLADLDSLLKESDFISVHAPLNDETRGMFDARRLALVKRGAILVNLARGGLLSSLDVLNEALESGRLAGVGLDVYPTEPPDVSHPIFRRSDVISTPHCMGLSVKAAHATFTMVSQGMADVFSGGTPENIANPQVYSKRGNSREDHRGEKNRVGRRGIKPPSRSVK